MFAFEFQLCTKKCPCKYKTVQQTNSYFNCSKCCLLAWTHALSLGRRWSMALSMTLCLNSAQPF